MNTHKISLFSNYSKNSRQKEKGRCFVFKREDFVKDEKKTEQPTVNTNQTSILDYEEV